MAPPCEVLKEGNTVLFCPGAFRYQRVENGVQIHKVAQGVQWSGRDVTASAMWIRFIRLRAVGEDLEGQRGGQSGLDGTG